MGGFARCVAGQWSTAPEARGYIAGALPNWLVTVNGAPAAREVECRHRLSRSVVARVFSGADGLYRFDGLPAGEEYDILGRDWQGVYNDVVWSRVHPVPYDVQSLTGGFSVNSSARTLEGALALVGGEAHVVSVLGSPPPGITFVVVLGEAPQFERAGFWIVASGSAPSGAYAWDLIVRAANGSARTLALTATIP